MGRKTNKVLTCTQEEIDAILPENKELIDDFMDYLIYMNEKYYRNGFVDGSQLVMGCFEK